MAPSDGDEYMDDCEDEGHEHEDMLEPEQVLMEAIFPPKKYCMKTSRPGGMDEYIKRWPPGTRYYGRISTG